MNPFEHGEHREHEEVIFCRDVESDLRAIIAIHSTKLGPAAGGCRMLPYATVDDALTDVLRLSQAMTVKNALAGLPLGGGKSVIIADAADAGKPARLRAFGRAVDRLAGRYWTAEDVGVGVDDAEILADSCRYVFGLNTREQSSGDPSPFTAHGVFQGIRAGVKHRLGHDDLSRSSVAVQGLGNVGYHVCRELHQAGARLLVSDINAPAVQRAVDAFGATAVDPDAILLQDVDVVSPCALGGTVTEAVANSLRATVVAGAANNQLANAAVGRTLRDRNVSFVPDFLINAGGMMNASCDIFGEYDRGTVMQRIDGIYRTALDVLQRAARDGESPERVAEKAANDIIQAHKE